MKGGMGDDKLCAEFCEVEYGKRVELPWNACYHIVHEAQPFFFRKFQTGGYDQDYFVTLLVTLRVQKHKAFSYTQAK
jgi:hypothetical protein